MAAVWIMVAAQATSRPASNSSQEPLIAQNATESLQPLYPLFARCDYAALLREVQQGRSLR